MSSALRRYGQHRAPSLETPKLTVWVRSGQLGRRSADRGPATVTTRITSQSTHCVNTSDSGTLSDTPHVKIPDPAAKIVIEIPRSTVPATTMNTAHSKTRYRSTRSQTPTSSPLHFRLLDGLDSQALMLVYPCSKCCASGPPILRGRTPRSPFHLSHLVRRSVSSPLSGAASRGCGAPARSGSRPVWRRRRITDWVCRCCTAADSGRSPRLGVYFYPASVYLSARKGAMSVADVRVASSL